MLNKTMSRKQPTMSPRKQETCHTNSCKRHVMRTKMHVMHTKRHERRKVSSFSFTERRNGRSNQGSNHGSNEPFRFKEGLRGGHDVRAKEKAAPEED
ncbi:hypothetical protein CDAR_50481 [Caerostris darwini]|uniref:C2H2-type domain-containing protein n=1 Tax=Caerostris darwini TaxID=1538125 RepID=A0AAV4UWZ3_9ARAC|nr:hypothetical protein CDAR_50481 [Caerostris darwini]